MIDHCEYTLLGIAVTEDEKQIDAAYQQTLKKYKAYENNEDPQKVFKYKRIIEAGTALIKLEKKRQSIIQSHQDSLAASIPRWLQPVLQQKTTKISPGTYDAMMAVATDMDGPYHLDKELATQVINEVMSDYKLEIGGADILKPPAEPRLIDDFSVVLQKNGLKLSWKLPDQDCDRIVIRRSYEDFPGDEKSGGLIFEGKGQDVLDSKVQPGRKVFYSAFSFFRDKCSTAKVTREGFFAEGVKNIKVTKDVGKIELYWEPPTVAFERIIIFRGIPNQSPDIVLKHGVPTPNKDTKRIEIIGKNHYPDGDIIPGATYYYSIYVDYGYWGHHLVFSEGQTISGSSIPPASPVENLEIKSRKEGLELTWDNPTVYFDSVTIVRSRDRYPVTDADGEMIYNGKAASFMDKKNIAAGITYYYSFFSLFQGHASAKVTGKKLYAGNVKDFTIPRQHVESIQLQWKTPVRYEEIILIRGEQHPPEINVKDNKLYISYGTQIKLPQNNRTEYNDRRVIPGKQYYYSIIVRYADGQYSSVETIKGSALEQPHPVPDIQASLNQSGHVRLEWQGLQKKKPYEFIVYRQDVKTLTKYNKAHCIGETNSHHYVDKTAVPGTEYEYAVYSRLKSIVADHAAKTQVFVTSEVELKRVVPGNRQVLLEWSPPPNVKRIEVYRDRQPIYSQIGSSIIDHGLKNDQRYHFTIKAVFADKSGAEIPSNGLHCHATPVTPPGTLRNTAAAYDGEKVTLTWSLPESPIDGILISRLKEPVKAKVCEIFSVMEIPIFSRLANIDKSFYDHRVSIGDVFYYAFYTVKQETAVYSGSLEVALWEEVKNLTANNLGDEICLQWDWPVNDANVNFVKVVRTAVGTNQEPKELNYTHEQYNGNGSMVLDQVDSSPTKYRYRVHTVRFYRGKPVCSLATQPGTSVEIIGGRLPGIKYNLKIKHNTVIVTCDISKISFPFNGLVLVRKKDDRPVSITDGEIIDRFMKTGKIKKIILQDKQPKLEGNTYYRVFLNDPGEAEKIKIESPPINTLKV